MHHKRKGLLIVIDGADGSGKQTQTELLVRRLKSEGVNAAKLSFPRYDSFFGKAISGYLRGEFGRPQDIDPKLASLLYAFDRFGAKGEILGHLDAGCTVVLDRYAESNMAYQGVKVAAGRQRQKFLAWLDELEYSQLGIPRTDLVIYLRVPVRVAQHMMGESSDKDEHEKDALYQQAVADMYSELASQRGWVVVDCSTIKGEIMSRQDIHVQVWEIVSRLVA